MAAEDGTATDVVDALWAVQEDGELAKVRARLAPDEPAIGMRMGALFAVAQAHQRLPLTEVDRLLDEPEYEPRMAAMCILDFRARRRLDEVGRRSLHDLYLGRHDRITTWDMVDRAAPRVVGGHLAGRSLRPLHDLAGHPDPLRRRTAITAPLFFVRSGSAADLAAGFTVAGLLADDPDPTVHRAVGIFVKHASTRDADAAVTFLDLHAAGMARPGLRLAVEKLPPDTRARYLSAGPA